MRKLFVWAMVATLLTAGSAFATGKQFTARSNATAGAAFFTGTGPTTTNNDDSCDIASAAPAATLLLPYFEVDINSQQTTAQTTLFTITNVTQIPQIAHVTVWTDLSFPVLDFNIFLTGYDVQGINLYDVIARGFVVNANSNLSTSIDSDISPIGDRSLDNDANPNFGPNVVSDCSILPGQLPQNIIADVRTALTTGRTTGCGSSAVGLTHTNAIGYVTIDVAATCSVALPIEATYYSSELLFDNTLIGDYQQINPNPTTGNYAGGNPLVHIRAIPEGGPAGVAVLTNLPYTFYDRYTVGQVVRTIDRRQPLPSAWAARFIQGGTGAFNTNFKIWREGVTGPAPVACSAYQRNGLTGTEMQVRDIVRFDEHENPTIASSTVRVSPVQTTTVVLPETSSTSSSSGIFPPLSASGDVGGWMYLNLNNGGSTSYSVTTAGVSQTTPPTTRDFRTGSSTTNIGAVRGNQDWVIVSMFAEGRYSVDFDAAWLGNGCSPSAPVTTNTTTAPVIGPAPNATP
ncbi:MAG TPA: hypothetical protein VII75_10940 [Thermoanaerobaculia bacterium]